ncbi:unnamed protein product [Ranitomeya imitator]|uniref:RRM domain-containing protein n=1 Tax=Ranitomeya imitator TaxID=111125 RepID=A0ABN9L9A7_9NEOB|nr:unnamed protein product [Ranitomeya imitator]
MHDGGKIMSSDLSTLSLRKREEKEEDMADRHSGILESRELGFGKSMPTNCVWIDGLSSSVTEQYLTRHFSRYGPVLKVVYDRFKGMALILYNEIEFAQAAVKETKGRKIGGNVVKVDFANQESQLAFYGSMESSGQDIRDIYEIISERR